MATGMPTRKLPSYFHVGGCIKIIHKNPCKDERGQDSRVRLRHSILNLCQLRIVGRLLVMERFFDPQYVASLMTDVDATMGYR